MYRIRLVDMPLNLRLIDKVRVGVRQQDRGGGVAIGLTPDEKANMR